MAEILIVGGGVAGLSAGIYGRLAGHKTTVIERHFISGGNLTGWKRGDYYIDNCIHWLTGTNENSSTHKTWRELGALENTEIIREGSLYTWRLGGESLSLSRDINKFEGDLLTLSPEDEREIKFLIRAIHALMAFNGIDGKEKNQGLTLGSIIKYAPDLVRLYNMSCADLAARFKHPLIKMFISRFIGEDFGALALVMVYATFMGDNGDLPRGGTPKMAENIERRYRSLGGELLLGYEVKRINLDGGRATSVTLADGRELTADYIIVTADPATVFGNLLDRPMPKPLKKQYESKSLYRFSSYHTAFACDTNEMPFEADVFIPVPTKYRGRLRTKTLAIREFSHEPSYAPKGKNIIQTMTYCDEEGALEFIRLRDTDREAYKAKKAEIAKIVERLIVAEFPSLEGKLRLIDVWTPATYKRFVQSEMGSFMSFLMQKKHLPLPLDNRVPGVKNLILAGQWLQSPGGLPLAADSGKSAIKRIESLEKNPYIISKTSVMKRAKV